MSVLDLIPDFGERLDAKGNPICEVNSILMLLPITTDPDNPDLIMLAGMIASHRCSGKGRRAIRKALRNWTPTIKVLH